MVDAYYPETLEEALKIREDVIVTPYAGGTDLMVKKDHDHPFLFLSGLVELTGIKTEGNNLVIGAAVTYADLLKDGRIPEVLRKAIKGIAAPAIRNLGTIGGNICNASPAGDTLPVLYALDAGLILQSAHETKTVGIEDFITGVKKTNLDDTQLLTNIVIPLRDFGHAYYKVGARRAQAISKLSFAGIHNIQDGVIRDISIAFGAVGSTVVRSREIEGELKDRHKTELDIDSIIEEYGRLIKPIDDQRSTARYRKKVCLNILREYLTGTIVPELNK